MKKSAFISDLLFVFGAVSLVTMCLFRYLGATFYACVALGCLCGGLSAFALGALWKGKYHASFLRKRDESLRQKLLFHLALLPKKQATELFYQALAKTKSVERIEQRTLQTQDELLYFCFQFTPVNADMVVSLYQIHTTKSKTLFCVEADTQAKQLCQRLGIRVCEGDEVYTILKNADGLPTVFLGEEVPKKKWQLRKKLCFSKRNAKRFFVGGALILLTSLWSPFPYYYLVFGSVFT